MGQRGREKEERTGKGRNGKGGREDGIVPWLLGIDAPVGSLATRFERW